MSLIFYFMMFFWAVSVVMTLTGSVLSVFFLRSKSSGKTATDCSAEGISVLKPVKGIDSGTEKNLESFFLQDYPRYELLFSVAEEADPAVPVIRDLIKKYPNVSAHLITENVYVGPNPKVNNLVVGYGSAQYDLVLISDSNVRVSADYLTTMNCEFAGSDMLCSIVAGTRASNLVGSLEEIFLNSFYVRPMVITSCVGHACMMGKSLLFRKDKMEQVGGLRSLANYLAEDFVAGEKFKRAGFTTKVSRYPVEQFIGQPSLTAIWSRHVRWGRIRKNHALPAFFLEPFVTNAFIAGATGASAFNHWLPGTFWAFFGAHLLFWSFCDLSVMLRLGQKIKPSLPALWLIREMTHLPLWINIACGDSVQWKGNKWKIRRDGTLTDRRRAPRRFRVSNETNPSSEVS